MKRLTVLTLTLFSLIGVADAQNPFEKYGYTPKIATLSDGRYNEFFDNDSIVQIGSVLYNTKSRQIVAFVQTDTAYSEATLQPDIVSRWLSPDPAAISYPSISPYVYTLNNPIRFVDIQGKWVAEIKDGIVIFTAEAGDNISTLEMQLGLPQNAILKDITLSDKTVLDNPNVGDIIKLQNLEVVQNINGYLSSPDINLTNCANCAMAVNGIDQINAWESRTTPGKYDPENANSGQVMAETPNILSEKFENIPENKTKIGDVVTYKTSKETIAKSTDVTDYYIKIKGFSSDSPEFKDVVDQIYSQQKIGHYSTVLLKDKTGQNVQQVFEKPGTGNAGISPLPNQNSQFIPAGQGTDTPFNTPR